MSELLPGFIAGTFPANVHRMIHAGAFMRSGAAGVSGQVQARSGIVGYKSLKVAPSSGLTVSIASGVAVVQGSGANQGAYVLVNAADDTVTLNTANATLPRKDAIVARVYDTTDGVGGNGNQWVIDKVTGTAAASPTLPSVPTDAVLLAEVNVLAAATTVSSGNITDRRTYTVAVGGVVPCLSSAMPTDPAPGQVAWVTDANRFDYWTGSIWTSLMIGAEIAYVQDTTDADAGAGSIQDVANLSLTFTLPAARKVVITAHCITRSTVSADSALLTITDAANNPIVRSGDVALVSSGRSYLAEFSQRMSLTAGTYTYKVRRQRVVGSGSVRVTSNTTDQIAWLQVVDCGP